MGIIDDNFLVKYKVNLKLVRYLNIEGDGYLLVVVVKDIRGKGRRRVLLLVVYF